MIGGPLLPALLAEILGDAHRYAGGLDPRRSVLVGAPHVRPRPTVGAVREQARDALERAAGRLGFAHPHFVPEQAADRLARLIELLPGLERTWAALGDERSRRALLDVLALRVLGPFHAPLRTTPAEYRRHQARVDRELAVERATVEVPDPWFSPLSLYAIPLPGGADGRTVRLHSHSVDVVSVFVLGQYRYAGGPLHVEPQPGDVVLDLGGCYGDTALLFADLVGAAGRVVVFEFDPANLGILRRNLELNPELAARIEIVERAVWDASGETLAFTGQGRMTAVATGGGTVTEVATVTVDDAVAELGLERVDFIKADVEGAEPAVLRGATATLRDHAPRLAIAAYHRDDDLAVLPAAITAARGDYRFLIESYSPVEDETILYGVVPGAGAPAAMAANSST